MAEIVEEREEIMVSPSSGFPTLRVARFLKPSITSIDEQIPNLHSHSLLCSVQDSVSQNPKLKVVFKGWRDPPSDWKTWVDRMHSLHQNVWKQAGIHGAILNSTYRINRDVDLVLGISRKWCSETNTFVFPWGEATITLEDMMGLGGYSVLGHSVFVSLKSKEVEIVDKLIQARQEFTSNDLNVSQSKWLAKFIDSRSEIEHEAFLALWLSRFVFPFQAGTPSIGKHLFPTAVKLARGVKIALAPAVLASIYRDLSLLKDKFVGLNKLGKREFEVEVDACSPMQFVQIWAWERFPMLRPKPNSIGNGNPRFARWHNLRNPGVRNINFAIDSDSEDFHWRPYAMATNHLIPFKFYREKEEWVSVDSGLDEELESFVRCVRVSELVGLDCMEQYCPHRVSMQFGMDQDIPGQVLRANKNRKIAWTNYTRPIRDSKLFIPHRLFESDVTTRYLEWWKQSYGGREETSKVVNKRKRRCKSLRTLLVQSSPGFVDGPPRNGNTSQNDSDFLPQCGGGITMEVEENEEQTPLQEERVASDAEKYAMNQVKKVIKMEDIEDTEREGGIAITSGIDVTTRYYDEGKTVSDLNNRVSRLEELAARLKSAIFRNK